MSKIVSYSDIERSSSRSVSYTTASAELSSSRLGLKRRTFISVTNLTAGVTATITLGDSSAVANVGITLSQGQTQQFSDDSGFECPQGSFQIIGSNSGTVSVTEIFEA